VLNFKSEGGNVGGLMCAKCSCYAVAPFHLITNYMGNSGTKDFCPKKNIVSFGQPFFSFIELCDNIKYQHYLKCINTL